MWQREPRLRGPNPSYLQDAAKLSKGSLSPNSHHSLSVPNMIFAVVEPFGLNRTLLSFFLFPVCLIRRKHFCSSYSSGWVVQAGGGQRPSSGVSSLPPPCGD